MRKRTKILYFLIIFILSLYFGQKTFAATKYFYWFDNTSREMGQAGTNSGYDTKEKCEEDLAKVHSSYAKSSECYSGENITIKEISPSEGKPLDLIKINGTDFSRVTEILFNNTKATNIISVSKTQISVSVPSGATTGQITVKTEYRGTAKSQQSFKVDTQNLYWWYTNENKQVMGAGGLHQIPGFASKELCETAKSKYKEKLGAVTVILNDCFQATTEYIDELLAAESKAGTDFLNSINNTVNVDAKVDLTKVSDTYTALAPIGDNKEIKANNVGDYLNTIIKLAIGLCGALAVIMIIMSGIQYMGDESVFGKTEAKSKIFSAILGLLIALGAYALLNTINPDLTGKNGVTVSSANITIVDLPDAGDGTIDSDFSSENVKYYTNENISSGIVSAVSKLKNGWSIEKIKISTNNQATIYLEKNGTIDSTNTFNIKPGINGYSEVGKGTSGDKKTPKGSWKILSIKTAENSKPVYNKTGSNMGASFWLLNPTISGERGIGIHGNKYGTLTETYGCIRMKNSDILALLPYIKSGITVEIGI